MINNLASQHKSDSASSGVKFDSQAVVVALRYWWKLALPMGLLLGLSTAVAICHLHKPVYMAEAWLLIKDKPDFIIKPLSVDSKKFVANQIEIMRSPRLLGPLASNPQILSTPELENEIDVVASIASQLRIAQRGKSDLYAISFSSRSPEKAQLVAKEVTDAYLAFHNKSESEHDSRIIRLLDEQRAARFEEMTQLRENVRALSLQLTGIDPFRASTKEEEHKKTENPFAALESDIVRQSLQLEYLSAEIKAEEEIQAIDSFEVSDAEIDRLLVQDPRYVAAVAKIERQKGSERDYQKTGHNLESNPQYRQLQASIAADQESLETLKADLRVELRETAQRQYTRTRSDRMAKMKREHALNLVKLKILQDNFEKAKGTVLSTAKQFTGDTLELEFKRAKLAQVTKIHDELYSRILAITTEQRAPERVERFKDATLPLRPVELIPWKLVGVGTPLSFLLPFGLAVAWEHLFRRVSSRQQLEGSSRQLTVVGEVTSLPSRKRGVRLDQVVGDRDMQLFEESVDGLRTVISLDSAIENMRVLAVTSAVSREGKTSLATQLAVSIARATGERTLLIDGDMRSPDLHWIFGTELEPGLVDLLKNECDLDEAIETGFSDKLHLLTAGKLNTSPHRLLGSGNFNSLLEKLLESYRHIVIDTPPVLPASESLVLARAADASIVCVRRDYSRLGHVDSACTRMANAGVKVIGAVINGIPVQQYLSRYGAYGYNVNN